MCAYSLLPLAAAQTVLPMHCSRQHQRQHRLNTACTPSFDCSTEMSPQSLLRYCHHAHTRCLYVTLMITAVYTALKANLKCPNLSSLYYSRCNSSSSSLASAWTSSSSAAGAAAAVLSQGHTTFRASRSVSAAASAVNIASTAGTVSRSLYILRAV